MTDQPQSERRNFFRVEDEIYLHYDLLSETEYTQAIGELSQADDSLFNRYRHYAWLNYEASQKLSTLDPANNTIVSYFEILNKKIDLLAQQIFDTTDQCKMSDKVRAHFSASGISFECQEPISSNHPIRVRILLLPENHPVLALGRVRHTDFNKQSNTLLVNVEFEHIHPIDLELMIRHNLNKQKQDLRARN